MSCLSKPRLQQALGPRLLFQAGACTQSSIPLLSARIFHSASASSARIAPPSLSPCADDSVRLDSAPWGQALCLCVLHAQHHTCAQFVFVNVIGTATGKDEVAPREREAGGTGVWSLPFFKLSLGYPSEATPARLLWAS